MKTKYILSICMMVKNEEKYLEKSLRSIAPFFDNMKTELIIVDTGSNDKTVEIASRYTKNVYFHKWNDDFASMRNKTIEYADGEWILVLDGDEVFEETRPLIKFLNSDKSRRYNAASIGIKNISSKENEEISQPVANLLRVFRNTNDFNYKGVIHEQPQFKKPIYFSDALILHYGYDYTDNELMEYKFKRNITLLQKELDKDPHNIYMLFQLSQTYSMYKKTDKALEIIEKAYDKIKIKEKSFDYIYIYNQLARLYVKTEKYKELEDICKEALKITGGFIDFYYYLAIAQLEMNKYKESIVNFRQYLDLLKHNKKNIADLFLVKDTLDFRENAYYNISLAYAQMSMYNEALTYLNKVNDADLLKDKINLLVDINVELGKFRKIREEYDKIIRCSNDDNLKRLFWQNIERVKSNQKLEDNIKLNRLFMSDNDEYSLLNQVRMQILQEEYKNKDRLINEIVLVDFSTLEEYFADLIYYLMLNNKHNIGNLLKKLNIKIIKKYIEYLVEKYGNKITNTSLEYLNNMKDVRDFYEIRFNKELSKALLINELIYYSEYKEVFIIYIDNGIKYIKNIYKQNIIENEMIYDLKDDEEVFLIYMYKARKYKELDERVYIDYLRKAFNIYPDFKEGIELLTKELDDSITHDKTKEFVLLQANVKESIKNLVNLNKLEEAKELIKQYNTLVTEDIEIYSITSVIAIMEGKINKAKNIIENGLKIDENNIDLNYNMAYIMELLKDYDKSYNFYKKVYKNTDDNNLKNEVYNKLLNIRNYR